MKLLGVVAGVAAAVAVASPAQALSDYGTVNVDYLGRAVIAGNGGVFEWQRVAGNPGTFTGTLVTNDPAGYFIGICLETDEFIPSSNPSLYTIRDLADAPLEQPPTSMGGDRATDVAKLVTLAFGGSLSNALTVGEATVLSFQTALWEISMQRTRGPGTYSTNVGNTQANTWLGLLNSEFNNPAGFQTELARNLFGMTRAGAQDMLVQTPIPAAAWLLGSGLLGLFGIARRRRTVAA
jgi:hypothetical protein